jgi:histidyl-tRNA synthetase
MLALEHEGIAFDAAALDAFVVVDGGDRGAAQVLVQELRATGLAVDMDYAGRSAKGQLTHAARTGARAVLVVRGHDVVVRRPGAADVTVDPSEVLATLTA